MSEVAGTHQNPLAGGAQAAKPGVSGLAAGVHPAPVRGCGTGWGAEASLAAPRLLEGAGAAGNYGSAARGVPPPRQAPGTKRRRAAQFEVAGDV
jgi:hypothetical protein